MIKFFRKIRQKLVEQSKTRSYFLYAIGEIVLVVIGILIALQVSNWNQERQEKAKLNVYFEKMIEDLEEELKITDKEVQKIDSLRSLQKRVLEILTAKNKKDIPELINVLGSVATAWSSSQSSEIFDEFMTQGLLSKVQDTILKQALRNLKDAIGSFKETDIYIDNQYNTLIEPYFAKNINYALVALPKYKKTLVQGGPETDFETLFNSMELWNVTTLKLETSNAVFYRLSIMDKTLKIAINALKNNIENQ